MADELRQAEARWQARSEQRDREISELREFVSAASTEIESLKDAVREAREKGRTSPVALWLPALATAVALGGFARFALVDPIVSDVQTLQGQALVLSGLIGEVKQVNVSQDERIKFLDRWLSAVQVEADDTREQVLKGED